MYLAHSLALITLAAITAAHPRNYWVNTTIDGPTANDLNATMDFTIGERALLRRGSEERCPIDHPNECSCYGEGQKWCSPPDSGSMADYNNECEAKRQVKNIIYTLCTKDPDHEIDVWYSWKDQEVKPGQNIYKCWPSKITPYGSGPYQ